MSTVTGTHLTSRINLHPSLPPKHVLSLSQCQVGLQYYDTNDKCFSFTRPSNGVRSSETHFHVYSLVIQVQLSLCVLLPSKARLTLAIHGIPAVRSAFVRSKASPGRSTADFGVWLKGYVPCPFYTESWFEVGAQRQPSCGGY